MKKWLAPLLMTAVLLGFTSTSQAASAISVTVDGDVQTYDQPPVVVNDRTMVPLRGIFEALGADLKWDPATQTINATRYTTKGPTYVTLQVGSKTASINGIQVSLEQEPQLINDRTMVPVRFVGESLGALVGWDEKTQTVIIQGMDYALMMAGVRGDLKQVQYLLDIGANPNHQDAKNGDTALSAAVIMGKSDVVKLLGENKANVNTVDHDNATPLFWAIVEKNATIVKLLLDLGADPNIRWHEGKPDAETALHYAVAYKLSDIEQLLRAAGAK